MTKAIADIAHAAVLVTKEFFEDATKRRLAIGREACDLALMLASLKAADLRDITVVVAEAVKTRHIVDELEASIPDGIDMGTVAIACPIQGRD